MNSRSLIRKTGWELAEERLRDLYAAGDIELDVFERRIADILAQNPLCVDAFWAQELGRRQMMIEAYGRGATVFGD